MSEQYIVSARKYRPADFGSVVGQKNLVAALKGAVASGRLAHAYLFCGPRGVGKTSCARIFARTINCLNPTPEGEACGQCESCRAIDRGNSFNIVELDAASNNSVQDIRTITEQVNVPPQAGRYRVFIIDEVHMLTSQAFNAFLKTLEEPPAYAVFILATTEKHKVLPTILSRCQIYDFKRIGIPDITAHLAGVAAAEGIQADSRALGVIASKADGAMRDALSIFDQLSASTAGNLTYEAVVENLNVLDYDYFFSLVDTFVKGDASGALLLYKDIRDRGFDSLFFVNSLARHVRDLMVAVDPRTEPLLETPPDIAARLRGQARELPVKWYYAAMRILNDCDLNYRTATDKQLLVELTLIRLTQLTESGKNPFDDSDRIVALRSLSEQPGATAVGAPSPPLHAGTKSPAPVSSAAVPPATGHRSEPEGGQTAPPSPPPRVVSQGATARHAPDGRPAAFRISSAADSSKPSAGVRNNPYTPDAFMEAWRECAASVAADRPVLAADMQAVTPREAGGGMYEIEAAHLQQKGLYEGLLQQLASSLRDRLSNDGVSLRVVLAPDAAAPRILPPKEFLQQLVEANPAMGRLLREIDAEMA